MNNFVFYIDLTNNDIPVAVKQRLTEFSELLSDFSINFIWLCGKKKINAFALKRIIKFERQIFFKKQVVISNTVSDAIIPKFSPLFHFKLKKYRFKIMEDKEKVLKEDYIKICFNNKPHTCFFGSCLGNCLYLEATGKISICPFTPNNITLNTQHNLNLIYDIFDSSLFIDLLHKTIEKRKQCKSNCAYFDKCLGGCALSDTQHSPSNCDIKKTIENVLISLTNKEIDTNTIRAELIEQASNTYKI